MAKIAIVGTGISGLGSAFLLNPQHDITVYEKAPRTGGHARTVTVDYDGTQIPVDTGFIVYNRPNYPNLSGLFSHLDVPNHASDMTFAASIRDGWLEWGAQDLNAVMGQRRNMLRPSFALLLRDVFKFNRHAQEVVEQHPALTLDGLISHLGLGEWFRRYYLLPMSGAIWSCPPAEMLHFPARTLIRFFANHHLLSFNGQPQWRHRHRRQPGIYPPPHRRVCRTHPGQLRRGVGDAGPSTVRRGAKCWCRTARETASCMTRW